MREEDLKKVRLYMHKYPISETWKLVVNRLLDFIEELQGIIKDKKKIEFYQALTEKLWQENEDLRKDLKMIMAMAGNPDPIHACRLVIEQAKQSLEDKK